MTDEAKNRQLCMGLYVFYAVSALLQFGTTELALLGALIMTIIVMIAQSKRKTAGGTPFESHFRWIIRTFWIGTGAFLPLVFLLALGGILIFTDWAALSRALSSGEPQALLEAVNDYMKNNEMKLLLITFGSMLPLAVWWVNRCWIGFKRARGLVPIENPKTWA